MKKVNLALYNNKKLFNPGAGYLKRSLWFLINAGFFICPFNPFSGLKIFLLRLFGARVGKGVVIKPGVHIKFPWYMHIGDNSWIGEKVWIDNLVQVTIGNNVCISQGAYILTGNHHYDKITFDLITKPVHLEEGVWIGAKAVVGPGIKAESHSVLTTGSVLLQNTEAYGIYKGNPAQKVKERHIS